MISAAKIHNDKVTDIKDRLNSSLKLLEEIYLEDIDSMSGETKVVKTEDILLLKNRIQDIYDFIFEKKDFNKHRAWRMFTEFITNYDEKLCR